MNIRLLHLEVRTRKTVEHVSFSETVTFLYGPVGTGKSTVARLIDFCFGGELERTPAIQKEFISVTMKAVLGNYECSLERGAEDTQSVRVSWACDEDDFGSVNAQIPAGEVSLIEEKEVFNLSDLLFYLCGVEPIKVLKKRRDPNSPMIRLSFRDIWWYCYLDQTHLDSSFYRLEDPFRGRKSQDAMRFFTGLHSERLSQLQANLYQIVTKQQGAREAVEQIRKFMAKFNLGSELKLGVRIQVTERALKAVEEQKRTLEKERTNAIHPTDELRDRLRGLSRSVSDLQDAVSDSRSLIAEQEALRAELITTKVKAERVEQAGRVLSGVEYSRCPQCSSDISKRQLAVEHCHLCGTASKDADASQSIDTEIFRRELNDRIDQISDSIKRRKQALERTERQLQNVEETKRLWDHQLQEELRRYDSAFIEGIRSVDREIAMLEERLRSLMQLQEMPKAISKLEKEVGESQRRIDTLRKVIDTERGRLRRADANAHAIAEKFKTIMLKVGFPGVSDTDDVVLDPRNWKPIVVHDEQEWGFWDTGSGGKKTLFNVCYALAVHEVARERGMPVPNILIIDSPTKNISEDENPELVKSLYKEIYRLVVDDTSRGTQFLLIDSDFVEPEFDIKNLYYKRMAGEQDAPSLISYYDGP